tara:strand:- start:972 stop:1184 length:213 start_codon:yes stop_codon:yes gene_type:complete
MNSTIKEELLEYVWKKYKPTIYWYDYMTDHIYDRGWTMEEEQIVEDQVSHMDKIPHELNIFMYNKYNASQ